MSFDRSAYANFAIKPAIRSLPALPNIATRARRCNRAATAPRAYRQAAFLTMTDEYKIDRPPEFARHDFHKPQFRRENVTRFNPSQPVCDPMDVGVDADRILAKHVAQNQIRNFAPYSCKLDQLLKCVRNFPSVFFKQYLARSPECL